MPKHDYTAKDALIILLGKIERASPEFADQIRATINAGKAKLQKVVERAESGKGPKRKRHYWETVPYSDEEALQVALSALNAYLVETRLFMEIAGDDFKAVGESPPKPKKDPTASGYAAPFAADIWTRDFLGGPEPSPSPTLPVLNIDKPKQLVIDAHPGQQILEKAGSDDVPLPPPDSKGLDSLQAILGELQLLADFKEVKNGDAR
jgi:hypothetical protein